MLSLGVPSRLLEETARSPMDTRDAEKGLVQVVTGATAVSNLALEAQQPRTRFGGAQCYVRPAAA